ncbi:hypothetical protein B0H13DRAFT_1479955, partial [Mycena leptocephala]
SSTEIAIPVLDMPLRVVQRVRQIWNEIGEVARQRARSGRTPLMSREAVDMMLDHSPDLFLDEIQDQLQYVHGLEISLRTISRTLKRLGMTSKQATERCEEARREFPLEVG